MYIYIYYIIYIYTLYMYIFICYTHGLNTNNCSTQLLYGNLSPPKHFAETGFAIARQSRFASLSKLMFQHVGNGWDTTLPDT